MKSFRSELALVGLLAVGLAVGLLVATASVAQEIAPAGDGRRPSADPAAPAARPGALQQGGLSLEAVVRRALQANPEILAAGARVAAAAERPPQARSLPDPKLEGMLRNVDVTDFSLGDEMMSLAGVRYTQALPYWGKRELRGAAAERGIDVAEARLDLIRRRVVRDVATAYFELEFIDGAMAIVEETRNFLSDLEQTAEARYAVGEGIQQDVLKAQVEISVLLNRLVLLEQMRDTAETRLNRQLDQPASLTLPSPQPVPAPAWTLELASLEAEAIESSALLRERARQVEQQEAALAVARREVKPDWMLSGAWMTRGSLPDVWEVNVGINLPIYRGTKQDRAIAEADFELAARQLDERDAGNVVAAAVRDQFLRADRAVRLTQLYSEVIIPQATLSLESATAGYEVGRVDFLTVLDNVVTLLTYQLEYQRQRADFLQAIVALEEHVGRSLGVTPASIVQGATALRPAPQATAAPQAAPQGAAAPPQALAGGGGR
jgi:outer membrane protein TolC